MLTAQSKRFSKINTAKSRWDNYGQPDWQERRTLTEMTEDEVFTGLAHGHGSKGRMERGLHRGHTEGCTEGLGGESCRSFVKQSASRPKQPQTTKAQRKLSLNESYPSVQYRKFSTETDLIPGPPTQHLDRHIIQHEEWVNMWTHSKTNTPHSKTKTKLPVHSYWWIRQKPNCPPPTPVPPLHHPPLHHPISQEPYVPRKPALLKSPLY